MEFNIPGIWVQTIAPLSLLPAITGPVMNNGYTQPGASANTLAIGNDAVLGLHLTASWCTARGLIVNHFNSGICLYLSNEQFSRGLS